MFSYCVTPACSGFQLQFYWKRSCVGFVLFMTGYRIRAGYMTNTSLGKTK